MSNYTPETATVISTLSYTETIDLSGSPDQSDYISDCQSVVPVPNTGWWKYTAVATDVAIAIHVTYNGVEADYVPIASIWTGDPLLPDPPQNVTCLAYASGNAYWLVPVTTPSTTYYIQVANGSNPYVAPTSTITLTVLRNPQQRVPAGSVLVPNENNGYPWVAISATGNVLRLWTLPATEVGDTLPSGEVCIIAGAGLQVFSNQLVLVASVTLLEAITVRGHEGGKWYVTNLVAGATILRTVNPDGSFGATSWTLAAAATAIEMAVSPDETIAYWVDGSDGLKIKRHNLITDTAMTDLVTIGTGSFASGNGDMACASDGSLLAQWIPGDGSAFEIRRYGASGSLLNTYLPTSDPISVKFVDRFRYEITTGTAFWAWVQTAGEQRTGTFSRIRISDGVVLRSNDVTLVETAGVSYDAATPFQPAESCPLLFVAATIGPSPVPSVTYPTRRLRQTPHLNDENLRLFFSRVELLLESGVGTADVTDPQVALSYSNDYGRTWSGEQWMSAGPAGAFRRRVFWNRLGYSRDRVWRITVSDPVPWRLFDLFVDVEKGTS